MKKPGVAMLLVMLLGGCAGASYIKQDKRSGQIALEGSFMFSMRRARTMMAEHCRGPVVVVEYTDEMVDYKCDDARLSAERKKGQHLR